jgi:NitT/TauT family transport system substrate-binding protein
MVRTSLQGRGAMFRFGFRFLAASLFVISISACAPAAPQSPTPAPPKPGATSAPAPTAPPAVAKPTTAPIAKPAAPAPATAAKAAAIQVPPPGGNRTIKIGYASIIQFTQLPSLITAERLNKEGWSVEHVQFAQADLVTQSVAKGEIQFAAGASNSAMLAIQKGARLAIIAEPYVNDWVVVATTALKQCQDLNGKRLALHDEAGVSSAMVKSWVTDTCKGTPNYLLISGSPNRAAAMISGQIDATPLKLADWVALNLKEPGRFHVLVNFSEGLADLATESLYANADWLTSNKELATAFLAESLKTHRILAEDPKPLEEASRKYLPEMDPKLTPDVIKGYGAIGGFPVNGGMTPEKAEGTIRFFTRPGQLEPGLTVDKVSNLSVLDAALSLLGRIPGKV